MKQFGTILGFELKGYLKNKVFVGVTLALVLIIAVVMFFPRISALFDRDNEEQLDSSSSVVSEESEGAGSLILISAGSDELAQMAKEAFSAAFQGSRVELSQASLEELEEQIRSGEVECAFVLDGFLSYTYLVDNVGMYDEKTAVADEILRNLYQAQAMLEGGLDQTAVEDILTAQVSHETLKLGVDQMENFFYTYIMIFALYMVILLYGQMVATNVATEKSSRAMELLITSARPTSMMFGKVIASGIAGLLQLLAVFGSALLFFNMNRQYWGSNAIVSSIFDMPIELLIYMLVFFILGFFIYAFMFGAVGSTASKLEDINTSVMPITLLFIAGFMVVVFSLSSGNVDSLILKVCSYIPFTSPMAMFTRIAMGTVPFYEIAISIVILIVTTLGVGLLAAKIYRVGVLLYGTTPKMKDILKSVIKA